MRQPGMVAGQVDDAGVVCLLRNDPLHGNVRPGHEQRDQAEPDDVADPEYAYGFDFFHGLPGFALAIRPIANSFGLMDDCIGRRG